MEIDSLDRSWGLNLFVLFELTDTSLLPVHSSWGLNLFVLFEHIIFKFAELTSSWGLNLFVLFELPKMVTWECLVLEDWIYLYYLNSTRCRKSQKRVLEDWIYLYYLNRCRKEVAKLPFLRIDFICIIWTSFWINWILSAFLRIRQ